MTGRVCPVHGEWSATGVCRWCEAQAPAAIMLPPAGVPFSVPMPTEPRKMHPDVPAGSTPCYCGKYAWAPWCREERNTVIDGVAHSLEQCFGLAEGPSSPTMYETTFTYGGEDAIAVYWILDFTPQICPEDLMAAFDAEVAAQHAALRWERVARRWATKHGGGGGTEEGRAYVWQWWLEQMDRQSAGLPLAGPFPLGFYAW